MATVLAELTPNSLLELTPPDPTTFYELSDGELIIVERAVALHEWIKGQLNALLIGWQLSHGLGRVFVESLFTLGPHTARMPDLAIVLKNRISLIPKTKVAIPIAPDLAIEIISDSETAVDVQRKVREYLAGGVQEIWQIFPDERLVRVLTDKTLRDYHSGDVLTSVLLTGFSATIDSFFDD